MQTQVTSTIKNPLTQAGIRVPLDTLQGHPWHAWAPTSSLTVSEVPAAGLGSVDSSETKKPVWPSHTLQQHEGTASGTASDIGER